MSKGFTLIEVIVVSLLLVLFSSFLFYLVDASLFSIKSSNEYLIGILKTSSMLESIRKAPFNELLSLDGSAFDDGKGTVRVRQRGQHLREIQLRYEWKKNRKPVELVTLKSRY